MVGFPSYPLEETIELEYDLNCDKNNRKEKQVCCSREPRKSEKQFNKIINLMLNLNNCVWMGKGMVGEIEYAVINIKGKLDELVEQVKHEQS